MKTKEANLWRWLSKARNELGSDLHMWRVENDVGSGMPDVEGVHLGRHFFVELKTCDRPKRAATPVRWSVQPSQPLWCKQNMKAGGNPWLLVQVGPERLLMPMKHIDQTMTYSELMEVSSLAKTPADAVLLMVR